VLEQWPDYEAAHAAHPGSVKVWARPRDITVVLGLPRTATTRATLSRALLRLYERGLVARASDESAEVGKSFRYLRITDLINAGAGNSGPSKTRGSSSPHGKIADPNLTRVKKKIVSIWGS
jgi:DNA-binding transcriptional ArsR family regulator